MFMIRLWGCLHKKLKKIELYTKMNNMVLNCISMKLLKYVYHIQYPHSEKIGKCIRKMWNLPYRELKIIYVDHAPRRRWSVTLFSYVWDVCSDFFPKRPGWTGQGSNSTQKKLMNTTSAGVQGQGHGDPMSPGYHVIKTGASTLWSASPNPNPQSNHEMNIRHAQTEGSSTKYLNSPPQNHQGHQNKGSLSPEEPEEMGQ